MLDVFQSKRREPRVKLHTKVIVTGRDANGEVFSAETVTVDVSPSGASLRLESPLACGMVVTFSTRDYYFSTRAVVRSIEADGENGGALVGVEYLDDSRNPLVIWAR
jgi:hypothetical protein